MSGDGALQEGKTFRSTLFSEWMREPEEDLFAAARAKNRL